MITHPTGGTPEHVCIVGLGPSMQQYTRLLTLHEPHRPWQEVWTVNTGGRVLPDADLLWVMDDLELFGHKWPEWGDELRQRTGRPLMTSVAYEEWPDSVAYPLADVAAYWEMRGLYLHLSQMPYLLAYAGALGVKKITLFGVDYSHAQGPSEAGVEPVCYWIGRLEGRGVEVEIADQSELLQTRQRMHQWAYPTCYGYLRPPIVRPGR